MPNLPPVIGFSWLQKQLEQNPALKLIDVRAEAAYRTGHIPGAVHFNLNQINLSQPPVNGLLPTLDEFNKAVSAIGLTQSDQAIIYDEAGGPVAARMVWTLKAFGHAACALLDGGFQHWLNQGAAVDTDISSIQASEYQANPDMKKIADRQYIKQRLQQKNVVLLDNRTQAEYEGKDIRAARGGHIPGALHYDWTNSKQPGSHLFKSQDELKQDMESLGITPDKEIICYCQTHQRSCVICLLLEALGYPKVKGYPGAWSDWGNSMDMPIENGYPVKSNTQ